MRTKANFLCLLLTVALASCAYHGNTPIATGEASFSTDNSANPTLDLPDHPWWQSLGSTELNQLVLESLQNNRDISIATKNIELAQSALDTVRLGWLPSLDFMGGRLNSDGLVLLPNLPVPLAGSGNFFAFLPTWVANIVQLPNKTKAAEKNLQATAADYLSLRTSIAAKTVASYALLLASIEEERLLATLQRNLQSQFNTTRSMNMRGIQSQTAVIEQDSSMQQLRAQIAINQANKIAARNALLTLLGRPLSTFTPTETLSDLNLNVIAPGNTPASVLATRPDVIAARSKIEAADYGISETASLFAPTVILSGATVNGSGSFSSESFSFQETVEIGAVFWVLDPQFIGRINTADKQYDAAVLNYLKVVEQAVKDVDNALADFEAKRFALDRDEKYIANQQQNTLTFQAMARNGLIPQTRYQQQLTELELARLSVIERKLQTVSALTTLYQSMGAGATFAQNEYGLRDQSLININRDDTKN